MGLDGRRQVGSGWEDLGVIDIKMMVLEAGRANEVTQEKKCVRRREPRIESCGTPWKEGGGRVWKNLPPRDWNEGMSKKKGGE